MTNKELHLIYLPGIGDARDKFQPWAVSIWRWWGVEAELYRMNWDDQVAWESKIHKLLDHIDEIAKEKKVALVGASAGAAAAVQAFTARKDKIAGVVTICGKINNPDSIGPRYRKYNPSFVEAAYSTAASIEKLDQDDRKRILCRYALFDEVIYNKDDSRIPGAHNRVAFSLFHAITIGVLVSLGAPGFIRFLKKQAAR
jgi:pimeloyl-ACP methyl ester carboxylesterase